MKVTFTDVFGELAQSPIDSNCIFAPIFRDEDRRIRVSDTVSVDRNDRFFKGKFIGLKLVDPYMEIIRNRRCLGFSDRERPKKGW